MALRMDRTRRPVTPQQSARLAYFAGCKCNSSQLGFFPDFEQLKSLGMDYFESVIGTGDRDAHIAAQNQAVEDMGAILTALDELRSIGMLNTQHIYDAISGIRTIAGNFDRFARTLGTDRAIQGSREVSALALQIVRDLQEQLSAMGGATYGGTAPIPQITPDGRVITVAPPSGSFMDSVSDYLPAILVAGFLMFMPKGNRRND